MSTDDFSSYGAWRQGPRLPPTEKRDMERFRHGHAAEVYHVNKIVACVTTEQRSYCGPLLDLSATGLSLLIPVSLPLGLTVAVVLQVGPRRVRAEGEIRNRNKVGGQYRLGVQFTDMDAEDVAFLLLLYGPGVLMDEVDGVAGNEAGKQGGPG